MALKILDKPNVNPVSGAYPYGDIKDNTGGGNGTPVNRVVYADFHQFFARIADLAGIVLNGLPDNLTNGFQFVQALQALIATAVAGEASIRSANDTTLQNNKADKSITITPQNDLLTGGGDLSANRIFGVGTKVARGPSISGSSGGGGDCNTISDNTIQTIYGGIVNGPGVTEYFLLFATTSVFLGLGSPSRVQVAIQVTGSGNGDVYTRSNGVGGWSAWSNANT